MNPVDICRGLGEARTRSIFLELTTDAMKKVLREAKLPTARMASHTSTRKRNDDWSSRVWRVIQSAHAAASPPPATTSNDKPAAPVANPPAAASATLLFEWLTRSRRAMLAEFLSACDVKHEGGLTDADFMKDTPPEKLVAAGKKLLDGHDKPEVAAYLLFLDASNASEIFAPLELDKVFAAAAA